jgi:3-methylfumaryl-CoA hydratase
VEENDWAEWIGRTQTAVDWVSPTRVAAWLATLDQECELPSEGDAIPLGFHWTLAPPIARESELGLDGHPERTVSGFLPPVPLPRRLWAGSRVLFHRPLRVGERVERESVIVSIEEKEGRSSQLVFVTVRHRLVGERGLAIEEAQDIVYRDAPSGKASRTVARAPAANADDGTWRKTIQPTETLLFRYSALTFNGHRIHYDREYAVGVEQHAGLVVHGPLIATLLLQLVHTKLPAASAERFAFRALRPTFDISDFIISGKPAMDGQRIELWSTDHEGERAIEAEAWIR